MYRESEKGILMCFIKSRRAMTCVGSPKVATGLENVSFHSNPKKKAMPKNFQTMTQLHSSHMLKIMFKNNAQNSPS